MNAGNLAWVAHASRVPVAMSHRDELSIPLATAFWRRSFRKELADKVLCGGTPQPARETRALPGPAQSAFI